MRGTFYNNFKTLVLLGGMTGLIMWIGSLIGGRQGVYVAFVFAAVMNFVSYFFSDKIALMSMHAAEVGPDHPLHQIVARLASRANLPMPRVYVSPEAAPNAFATGRNPRHAAVCATEGLLQMLSRNEVSAVMAHELAHVRHRDILITTIAATIGAAISMLAYSMMWFGGGRRSSSDNAHPLEALLVMLLGPLAAMLIQAAISRSREFNADTVGAQIHGNPDDLASALKRIHSAANRIPLEVNPAFNSMFIAEPLNAMGRLSNMFLTHPPLEARLENLIGVSAEVHARFRGKF